MECQMRPRDRGMIQPWACICKGGQTSVIGRNIRHPNCGVKISVRGQNAINEIHFCTTLQMNLLSEIIIQ